MVARDGHTPDDLEKLINWVREDDRRWFQQNPDAQSRVRPYYPGEIHPHYPDAHTTIVRQVAPGIRHKTFVAYPVTVGAV
jgi:hypothetical protein